MRERFKQLLNGSRRREPEKAPLLTSREDAIIGKMQQSEEVAMLKKITRRICTIGIVTQALADLAGYTLAALVGVGVFALLGVAAWSPFSYLI